MFLNEKKRKVRTPLKKSFHLVDKLRGVEAYESNLQKFKMNFVNSLILEKLRMLNFSYFFQLKFISSIIQQQQTTTKKLI